MVDCNRLTELCALPGPVELTPDEAREVSAHLTECQACRDQFAQEPRLRDLLPDDNGSEEPLWKQKTEVSTPVPADAEAIRFDTEETVGCHIGGFRTMARIGEGGMGEVFKAYQIGMDRVVALKLLSSRLAKDVLFVERFFREARAAAKLRHPNIVQAFDAGVADGFHYLALEYVDGESLITILERDGPLPQTTVLEYAKQICNALSAAHSANIIHRDIKPDNLLVDREGAIRVLDFGLAKAQEQDAALTTDGQVMGTPIYLSPEMAAGKEVDARTDLYSLGVTMFQLLAGRPPFMGKRFAEIAIKHARDVPPALHSVAPTVDRRLCRIVDQLLAKSPDDRHASAAELLADLERLGPLSVPENEGLGGRKHAAAPWLLTIAATLAVCLASIHLRTEEHGFPSTGTATVLFDGSDFEGWRAIRHFDVPPSDGTGIGGQVFMEDGWLVLGPGNPMSGAAWTSAVPRIDYEITFEAKRLDGRGDFCLAFPVYSSTCLLQAGAWDMELLGIDVLDGRHPPDNETGQAFYLEQGTPYRFCLRVTDNSLAVRVNGRTWIDFSIAGHRFSLDRKWRKMDAVGIGAAWGTSAAFRNIKLRRIPKGEGPVSCVIVRADAEWSPSGLRVTRGKRLRLRSRGIWGSRADELMGPDGNGLAANDEYPVPSADKFSLVGRIGEDGPAFQIGTDVTVNPDRDGDLFLRMNDFMKNDNVGSVRVTAEEVGQQG